MKKLTNAGKVWTPEEIAHIGALFNAGKSLKEIAESAGRTGSSVVAKMCQQRMLWSSGDGHYYPVPEAPWAMWQEVKSVDEHMKGERVIEAIRAGE